MTEKRILGEKSFICIFVLHSLKTKQCELFFRILTFLSGVPALMMGLSLLCGLACKVGVQSIC